MIWKAYNDICDHCGNWNVSYLKPTYWDTKLCWKCAGYNSEAELETEYRAEHKEWSDKDYKEFVTDRLNTVEPFGHFSFIIPDEDYIEPMEINSGAWITVKFCILKEEVTEWKNLNR